MINTCIIYFFNANPYCCCVQSYKYCFDLRVSVLIFLVIALVETNVKMAVINLRVINITKNSKRKKMKKDHISATEMT